MKYIITEAAKADLAEAAEFYNSRRAGLGAEFALEAGLGLSKVLERPNSWPEIAPGFRKYRLDRFPYALVYRILSANQLEIVAIHDLRSRPGSWRQNLR